MKYPTIVMPANRPQANNSPLCSIFIDSVNSPPERKGPTLRPAAEMVCAMPFMVPRDWSDLAEFVICQRSASAQKLMQLPQGEKWNRGRLTKSITQDNPPTALTFFNTNTPKSSRYNQADPVPTPKIGSSSLYPTSGITAVLTANPNSAKRYNLRFPNLVFNGLNMNAWKTIVKTPETLRLSPMVAGSSARPVGAGAAAKMG